MLQKFNLYDVLLIMSYFSAFPNICGVHLCKIIERCTWWSSYLCWKSDLNQAVQVSVYCVFFYKPRKVVPWGSYNILKEVLFYFKIEIQKIHFPLVWIIKLWLFMLNPFLHPKQHVAILLRIVTRQTWGILEETGYNISFINALFMASL